MPPFDLTPRQQRILNIIEQLAERFAQRANEHLEDTWRDALSLRTSASYDVYYLERFLRDARAGLTHPPNDDAALELLGKAALS